MDRCERYFSLDTWFGYLLNFYEICGFHHSTWSQRKIIKYFMIGLQIFMMNFFTVNAAKYIVALTEFAERLVVLNFTFFYTMALLSYWTLMIESYAQKSVQKRFWEIFGQMNGSGHRFNQNCSLKQLYLCKFLIHLILFIVMLLVSVQDKNTTATAVMTYYVLLFMCNNWLFYFLFYLILIKFELEQIRNYLPTSNCEDVDLKNLKRAHNHYQHVYEMIDCVNRFFGWSQCVTILLSFYTILTYCNFIYQLIDRKFEGHGLKIFF